MNTCTSRVLKVCAAQISGNHWFVEYQPDIIQLYKFTQKIIYYTGIANIDHWSIYLQK